jgi:cytochrome c-type biogenesis protein CcmE
MADANGVELKVVYNGTIPNNFETATSVVVTGQYKDGYFHAKDILTKCPSKYEEQYEEQKVKTSGI